MTDFLSIEQVAERTPWGASTLYRIAKQGDSPFKKLGGRWVTTPAALEAWFEQAENPTRRDPISRDPMGAKPRRRGSFRAEVVELDERRAA